MKLFLSAKSYQMPWPASPEEMVFQKRVTAPFQMKGTMEASDCHSNVFSCPKFSLDMKWTNSKKTISNDNL